MKTFNFWFNSWTTTSSVAEQLQKLSQIVSGLILLSTSLHSPSMSKMIHDPTLRICVGGWEVIFPFKHIRTAHTARSDPK